VRKKTVEMGEAETEGEVGWMTKKKRIFLVFSTSMR